MVTEFLLHLPMWEMIRVLGILSYLLLFGGVSLGICYSMPGWPGKTKSKLYKAHSFATISGMFVGIFHAMLLIVDTYMPFTWPELLVPFSAAKDPFWNGLGSIAVYGMILIILSTDLKQKLKKHVWRAVHLGSYPTFLAALAHGIGVGSDTQNGWVFLMYVTTFVIVCVLLMIRAWMGGKERLAHPDSRG